MRPARGLSLALLLICSFSYGEEPSGDETAREVATETPTAHEPAPVPRPAQPERSVQDANALRRQTPLREQQELEALGENFLALWKPANVGQPLGAVIILPGDNQHAETPAILAPLRHKLPDAGWHTLSLSLPDPFDALPERAVISVASADETSPDSANETGSDSTNEAEQASSTDSAATEDSRDAASNASEAETQADAAPAADEESLRLQVQAQREERLEQHKERIFARIDAALALSKQQDAKRIMLLGQGSGGYWAVRYLKDHPDAPINGLILVSPLQPDGFTPEVDELVADLKKPVGDFHFKNRQAEALSARLRQQASKRAQAHDYQVIGLQALSSDPVAEQEQVYRRVRGWLTHQTEPR